MALGRREPPRDHFLNIRVPMHAPAHYTQATPAFRPLSPALAHSALRRPFIGPCSSLLTTAFPPLQPWLKATPDSSYTHPTTRRVDHPTTRRLEALTGSSTTPVATLYHKPAHLRRPQHPPSPPQSDICREPAAVEPPLGSAECGHDIWRRRFPPQTRPPEQRNATSLPRPLPLPLPLPLSLPLPPTTTPPARRHHHAGPPDSPCAVAFPHLPAHHRPPTASAQQVTRH